MNILEKIINEKQKDLPAARILSAKPAAPTQKDFAGALTRKNGMPALIAELKRKSPSKGDIRTNISVEEVVNLYEPFAAAMSILTETRHFGGSLTDLSTASSLTKTPLLRKDFLIDPVQVKESRLFGADAYLLIMAALSDSQFEEMLHAGRELNMPALVEVHNEKETERALKQDIHILGINNRNLEDLSIDLNTTSRVLDALSSEVKLKLKIVSESGLSKKEDLTGLPHEVDAVLMGTAIMSSDDPAAFLKSIFA
ncbi:MAG: indole-3-glycerol phosphate synthase TrpC [Spirochaetia bacterium]|nr:indole-3-glycerol phosphate synthase TrpC [Spirochaetia bacterium]